jgi:MFS family permease
VDTYGIRRTLLACALLMTAACFGMAMATNGPAVALGLFALRLGNKSSELAFKTQVNYHYVRARGRAMAVTSMFGNQLGSQVAVPLAANLLCAATDLRTTYRTMGVSVTVIGCAALALARERFADGVEPGSDDAQVDAPSDVAEPSADSSVSVNTSDAWTKGRVMRCPSFWAHVLVVFVAFNMELGWIYDVREVVLGMGVVEAVSGVNTALILRAVGGGLGTLLGGIVYDRWGARVCMCSAQIVQVIAMCLFGWPSPPSLWAICVLAGLQSGMVQVRPFRDRYTLCRTTRMLSMDPFASSCCCISPCLQNTANVVFADYFGLDIAGSIQGIVQMIGMGGAAFGPITLAGLAKVTVR